MENPTASQRRRVLMVRRPSSRKAEGNVAWDQQEVKGDIMGARPKMPAPQPTVRMPMPTDEKARMAKKTAQNRLMGSKGRESTDLAGEADDMLFGR